MWIRKDLKNKDLVKQISPNHLVKRGLPNTLIIHGSNDRNVPFFTAQVFYDKMRELGNSNIQFEKLNDAEHSLGMALNFRQLLPGLGTSF